MTTNNEIKKTIEEQFAEDCKIINLKYEYPTYDGKEKWAIISPMPESCLQCKYGEIISTYEPFLFLTEGQGEAILDFRRNEQKYKMRQFRNGVLFDFSDGETGMHHTELLVDDVLEQIVDNETKQIVMDAIRQLKEPQQSRIIKHYFLQMTVREIAQQESVRHTSIVDSLQHAKENLKIILKKTYQSASPSAFK